MPLPRCFPRKPGPGRCGARCDWASRAALLRQSSARSGASAAQCRASLQTLTPRSVRRRAWSSTARAALQDEETETLGDGCAMRHRVATLPSGMRLHFVESGPADAPLVLLIHGFPDLHLSWRLQLPALSAAGFRAVAVDLRGYGRSSAPPGVSAYSGEAVVGDLLALLDLLIGPGKAAALVIGHDWGARVAWGVAEAAPERVERLCTINVPHPDVFARTLRDSAEQRRRSWYIAAFQLPLLPERILASRDCLTLRRLLAGGPNAHPALPPALIEQYVAAFKRPGGGGFRAPLCYYRAAARGLWPSPLRRIEAPVLVLWGEQDPYLMASMADPPALLAPRGRVVRFPNASHWVHWQEPDAINAELLALLREPAAANN